MFESSGSSDEDDLEDLTDDEDDDDDDDDECPTECNFDGDDEQSDFCDSNVQQSSDRNRNRVYCHSRPKLEFKIPSRPANPFYTVDLDPSHHHHHHQTINLWKRRRPMH